MSGVASVGFFLFSLIFSLLTFVLWARIALRYFHVSSLHPTTQAINTFTDPLVRPFQRLFKSSQLRAYRYDWACFTVLVLVELLKFTLIGLVFFNINSALIYLLMYTVADLIIQPCNLLFYATIIRVIMSWLNPNWQNPLADLIYMVTEPLLRLARRFIPIVSGIDFSPFIVIIALKIITLFISASLPFAFI